MAARSIRIAKLLAPLLELKPPLGDVFCRRQSRGVWRISHFEEALRAGGHSRAAQRMRCRRWIAHRRRGVRASAYPLQTRAFLEGLRLKDGPASILLNHVPNRLPLAEHAGVSLQLSGHTHGGGQLFPFNFITRRAFGKFTYGLQRFGEMQVYTSSGAGTWGPPMRVGTHSEIVLLTFA